MVISDLVEAWPLGLLREHGSAAALSAAALLGPILSKKVRLAFKVALFEEDEAAEFEAVVMCEVTDGAEF